MAKEKIKVRFYVTLDREVESIIIRSSNFGTLDRINDTLRSSLENIVDETDGFIGDNWYQANLVSVHETNGAGGEYHDRYEPKSIKCCTRIL